MSEPADESDVLSGAGCWLVGFIHTGHRHALRVAHQRAEARGVRQRVRVGSPPGSGPWGQWIIEDIR